MTQLSWLVAGEVGRKGKYEGAKKRQQPGKEKAACINDGSDSRAGVLLKLCFEN